MDSSDLSCAICAEAYAQQVSFAIAGKYVSTTSNTTAGYIGGVPS